VDGAIPPAPDRGGGPIELLLCGYTPGSRVTLDVRVQGCRVAVKIYAEDPTLEAELYQALAVAGLAGNSGVRVPRLLAWEPELRMMIISWLEGPTAHDLVKTGKGERAGELAAQWLRRVASVQIKLGAPYGSGRVLHRARKWVANLSAIDPTLGTAAVALAGLLEQTQPTEGAPRLVHGSLYERHILELGDGPGVIDWNRFGQGPLELDAGMFLATITRLRLLRPSMAGDAARTEKAFLEGTAGLVEERALAWHWAAALLHLTNRLTKPTLRRRGDWLARAHVLLVEARQLAEGSA
jgi:aminoglycoside phosphotransferase (APT) family kinase protein